MTQLSFAEQCMVRLICALALLLIGFFHQPPAPVAIPPGEIVMYTLPDGSVSDLCLPSSGGKSKQDHHDRGSGCEACRLTGSTLLPTPTDLAGQPINRRTVHFSAPWTQAFYRQAFRHAALPRGPPFRLAA